MLSALLHGFFKLIRFTFNFDSSKEETRNFDEICRQLEVLQLDFANAEKVSDACIYLADPHKLPGPAKDSSKIASKGESNENDGMSHFHHEKTNEQSRLSKQYQKNGISISSNFERTLLNHFQHTPISKRRKNSSLKQRHANGGISVLANLSENSKSYANSQERNLSQRNVTETVGTNSSKSLSSKGRKGRVANDHFDESSSPVQHFCSTSLVASTPLLTKPDNENQDRLTMANNAVTTGIRQSKQQILLNFSTDSADSINTVSSKDETIGREQGAITKHIARIRTSNSTLNSSKKTLFNDTSRYYSMRTSFGGNSSTSFS